VADLAQRYQVHPNAWKKQLQCNDGAGDCDREIERLHPKIGQLIVER